jgi:hypothetical protein
MAGWNIAVAAGRYTGGVGWHTVAAEWCIVVVGRRLWGLLHVCSGR